MKISSALLAFVCLVWSTPAAAVCGDDVVDFLAEVCDGLDDSACPSLCVPPGSPDECTCAPAVCGDGIVSPPFEACDGSAIERCANGCAPDCTCLPLDHFQCYEAKPANFANRDVSVEDAFGSADQRLRYPHRLCLPADKNGEGIVDAVSHLTGYPTRGAFERVRNVEVENQFGSLRLDLLRPDYLMVPTARDGVAIPPSNDLDHFRCYKVKRSSGAPQFAPLTATVGDAFETAVVRVAKPLRLCMPANKNGEDPTAPGHDALLLCYKTQASPGFGTRQSDIENQFGLDSLRLIHRRELCLPSQFASEVE